MPDVSVLISSFNGHFTLNRAIQSALQKGVSVEVCVCDDASSDDTAALIAGNTDPHVKVTRHATNKGTAEGLNSAAELATGKYFIILGDDDTFEPQSLSALVNALNENPEISFVYGSTRYYGARNQAYIPRAYDERDFWKHFASLYAVLYRREAWDAGLRYQDLIWLENGRGMGACDYDFVLQMIARGSKGLALPEVKVLNYLYNPKMRQAGELDARMGELVAKFRERWTQWEGNSL